MSLTAGEVNPSTGLPYGFFPQSGLEGYKDGFPLVISSYLGANRALNTLQYMFFGGLLHPAATESLSLEMLIYNPSASIFGRLHALVKWQTSGHFHMDFRFVGLPAVEYSSDVYKWKANQMVRT